MTVKPIPDGYSTATPYLTAKGTAAAIDYYKKAFGAEEIMRHAAPDGRVAHAEIKIGNSRIMLGDEFPEMNVKSPKSLGGTPVSIYLYVNDVDSIFKSALAAGGTSLRAVQDEFYGDRAGTLVDPFGHRWTIATHKEDVPKDELERRMKTAMSPKAAAK
jgi:PhnB protein